MVLAGGKKKMLATLVGCNYAGTENELQGCINDVHAMRALLLDRFGFAPADITVLTDDHKPGSAGVLPTGAAVKRALSDMVARAAPGDVLFFHYSGHGTFVPPVGGHAAGARHDEAIVPCDLNLIYDVDFRKLLDRVPQGATFTMVSDSCYSGGLFDQDKEQIGPDAGAAGDRDHRAHHAVHTGRLLPYPAVLAHLSAASGVDASQHVGDHLVALFGDDASAKFHSAHRRRHGHHGSSSHSGGDAARTDDAGILLSGCQKDETSADVAGHGGKPACGAFSDSLQAVLAAHPAPMSNRELVRRVRKVLGKERFEQHPCLYCNDANADAPFLGQKETRAKSN